MKTNLPISEGLGKFPPPPLKKVEEHEIEQAIKEIWSKDHKKTVDEVQNPTRIVKTLDVDWKSGLIFFSVLIFIAITAGYHLRDTSVQDRFDIIDKERQLQGKYRSALVESEKKELEAKVWLLEKRKIDVK